MKIAIFHNLLSGGAKRTLYEFCLRLAPQHELWVYSLSCSNQDFADVRPLVARNVIYDFTPSRMLPSPFGRVNPLLRLHDLNRLKRLYRRMAREMMAENFDLYFINPSQFENSPYLLNDLEGQPTVYFCQEPLRIVYEASPARPYDKPESARRKFLNKIDPLPGYFRKTLQTNDREAVRSARLVLVNSQHVQANVKAIYQVDAQVNYLGVDSQFFRPLDLPRQRAVVSVGSLTPLKGFDFLIRSLALIPADIRPPLWIVSNFTNPPERVFLSGLAQSLGVELKLFGGISDQQLVELYNQALMTVYAPVREPFGLVAIESMACGTPVIGVNDGGLTETILDGQVGRLVARDEAVFAQAVEQLLRDDNLRDQYGIQARSQVLQQWTWDAALERLKTNFQRVRVFPIS